MKSYEDAENGCPQSYYRITKSGHAMLVRDRKAWRKPEPSNRPWAAVAVRNSCTTGLSSTTVPNGRTYAERQPEG